MALNHILPLSNVALIFLYLSFFTCSTTADEDSGLNCVYTVYIRTSKKFNGGTNSNVGVSFYDETGNGVYIKDLVAWGGLMGLDHDYYERGNLDIFSGRGPCLYRPVCYMELISDGSGPNHEWYCNYVEVTTTGSRYVCCAQQLFTVEQWLASGGGRSSNNNNNNNSNNNSNNSINQLIVTRDACNKYYYGLKRRRRGSSVLPVETLLAASA